MAGAPVLFLWGLFDVADTMFFRKADQSLIQLEA